VGDGDGDEYDGDDDEEEMGEATIGFTVAPVEDAAIAAFEAGGWLTQSLLLRCRCGLFPVVVLGEDLLSAETVVVRGVSTGVVLIRTFACPLAVVTLNVIAKDRSG